MKYFAAVLLLIGLAAFTSGAEIRVEAERFAEKGGWVVDPQFVHTMGSPCLLALLISSIGFGF
jgi:hypothetical protein